MFTSTMSPPGILDREAREERFFSEPVMLSYSGLNKLLFSPQLFYNHYVLNMREDSDNRSMIEGQLLHCLVLEESEFSNKFSVMGFKMPGDSARNLCKHIFYNVRATYDEAFRINDLAGYETEILEYLKEINLHQGLVDDKDPKKGKTGDQKRLEKVLTTESIDYFFYLCTSEKKTIISQEEYEFAKNASDLIKNNPVICDLMGIGADSLSGLEVENETMLAMTLPGLPFGARGILDNSVFDFTNKVVRINDLKKSSKHYTQFVESIEYYKYNLQGAIYRRLVEHRLRSIGHNPDEWTIEFRFIVVDPYLHQVPVFISEQTMKQWLDNLDVAYLQAAYHFTKRDFSQPYELLMFSEITL